MATQFGIDHAGYLYMCDGSIYKSAMTIDKLSAVESVPPPLPVMKQRYVSDDPKTGPVSEERYELALS